uniref:RING-type domain-containing protein n=1 Tax=Sphaeramia orbicularis TaxID=375764 RepID=A0A672YXN7_9TELE
SINQPMSFPSPASFALDEARLCCSICLELFKDPVTIPCGHSYCMSCLTDLWDHEQTCSCPQCRASFSPRPSLGRNNLLVEMLQSFRALKLSAAPSAPPLYQEEYSFEHPTFDVSSVQPERTDGEVSRQPLTHI